MFHKFMCILKLHPRIKDTTIKQGYEDEVMKQIKLIFVYFARK